MRYGMSFILTIVWVAIGYASQDRADLLIADFESETYPSGWLVTGDAFGPGPAAGKIGAQMDVSGYQGERLVNTFFNGDSTTGTLTSPQFQIERNYIQFLIGGGNDPERLTIQLFVDDQPIRTATGPNKVPGGSEKLDVTQWDVSEYIGKTAKIAINDQATGGWGHINIDEIVQTDLRIPVSLFDQKREFTIDQKNLVLPIRNGAPMRKMTFYIDDQKERSLDIELAEMDADADFHVCIDMGDYLNQKLTLVIDQIREDHLGSDSGFGSIKLVDKWTDDVPMYSEKDRPSFHLTSQRGWNNDPNGMVFYQGKYHLFWQHNPVGWNWGNMHWAHAVSDDMLHWQEFGDALIPDELGPMFSGSAVTDWQNTSGFGTLENPPMVAAYTAAGSPTVQCIAYSTDGKTLTKWEGNPIIEQITPGNRDPKLLWYAPGNHWVLVLYVERPVHERKEGEPIHAFRFFSSPDLKTWKQESEFYGVDMFECPDLFELPVLGLDGSPETDVDGKPVTKWVLYGADGRYLLGNFDGKTYVPDGVKQTLWYGRFYAAQTFSDTPDGRRIQIGWANGVTFPGMPFNQQMTIPVELSLQLDSEGKIQMRATPIREIESLRGTEYSDRDFNDKKRQTIRYESVKSDAEEICLTYGTITNDKIKLSIHGVPLVYDSIKRELTCGDEANRVTATLKPIHRRIQLRILVDRGSIEIFDAAGGRMAMSVNTQTPDENLVTEIPTRGLESYQRFELKSIWGGL